MKKIIIAIAAISMMIPASYGQKIKGSDTVLPLAQKHAESYAKKNSSSNVTVTGGGSGVGISALIEGSTDIAMSSRKIKFDEKLKLNNLKKPLTETIIAYDALAVIVNPANKVSNLTREQLEAIFTGKITSWKELGGEDMKIVVYSRETSSGTYEFFKESILKNKNYMSSVLSMPATGAIIQSISQTKGAIGYVGLAYLSDNVKAVNVSYDGGKNFIKPSFETAKDKTYPVVRPLFFYTTNTSEEKNKPFIDYVMSSDGQREVKEIGYIPVK